jgi:hypothetical protein
MFHLPLPIEGSSREPTSITKRYSRGYTYNILKYHFPENEYDYNNEKYTEYTVITDELQTKIFAYMAPRITTRVDSLTFPQESSSIEVKAAIEGTMITFFWNDDINEWTICTRNGVGCDYSFFRPTNPADEKPKTFREMVLDAFRSSLDIENTGSDPIDIKDLNDVSILQDLSKSHIYTCVLQHPENHIVYSIVPSCAFLKLVRIYERNAMPPLVPQDSNICFRECIREISLYATDAEEEEEEEDFNIRKTGFRVFGNPIQPTKLIGESNTYRCASGVLCNNRVKFLKTTEEVEELKQSIFDIYYREYEAQVMMGQNTDSTDLNVFSDFDKGSWYFPPAWILTNQTTGHICEISNPFYERAKQLRNMQPNLRYQYLELRKNKQLQEYLHAFPRYYMQFMQFSQEYDNFITVVYTAYIKYYVMRVRENIPKRIFVHAARIHHEIYLASVPRTKINRQMVEEYFEKFESTKMFYYLTERESDSAAPGPALTEGSPPAFTEDQPQTDTPILSEIHLNR